MGHNPVHSRRLGVAIELIKHRSFIYPGFEKLYGSCKIITVIFSTTFSHYFVELSHNSRTDKDYSFYILKLCK